MGCCSEGADSELHLIYHSTSRELEGNKKIAPPVNWNPRVANEVVFNNLKPYLYRPQGNFKWYNRVVHPGIQNPGNLQQMGSI
jgi:hypothetical protein